MPNKSAYPDMDAYRLNLMFYHTLSSSTQAFVNMLKAPIERASDDEQALLQEMQTLATAIKINGKTAELLKILKPVFAHLKQQKESQKAIIFVDNLITLDTLNGILHEKGYLITKSLDEFRNDKSTQILITNDELAKGLDIEFCPVVVNYDLLYNAVEMEQRICRCHRQGQQSDVLVINMLSPENFSDVRILELMNKRMLQFSGIFGVSDNIVGNFEASLEEILQKRRSLDKIQADFTENLASHQADNEETVANAEDVLFTTFTKKVAENVIVSPNYIAEKCDAINRDLWEVVKYYFETELSEYVIDEESKTITLPADKEPQSLFYYWTGSRNKPYTGQRKYGASKDFKPSHNRITPASVIAIGALQEVKCPSQGTLSVHADIESCEITFFAVDIRCKTTRYTTYLNDGTTLLKFYNALTGKTESGRILTEKECLDILQMPVVEWSGNDTECHGNSSYSLSNKETFYPNDPLGDNLIKKYSEEKSQTVQGDIDLIQLKATRQKTILEQSLAELRQQVKKTKETALGTANDRLAELQAQKKINALEKELKSKEQGLFFEQMRIDAAAEKEINQFTLKDELFARPYKIFKVQVKGIK